MSILLAKRFLPALSTIVAGIILAGCGSGGDSQTGPIYPKGSAVLKDTTVAGITYVCSNETNVTTQEGRFFYDGQCAKVDFKIGGMKIGSIMVSDIHEDGKIYIAELLGLPRDATEDPRLKALLQLVQSLDKDHNPYNGIVVDPAKESALQNLQGNFVDLDSNTTKINDIEAAGISLTPKNHAVAHYEDTLRRDLGLDIDTVPPAPPVIQENLTEVYTDTTPITLYGEAHAHIRLDGNDTGLSIDENNTAILQLPTINIDDNNTFEILLVDDMNQESEPLVVSIYRPSIATLNARDVQEALNLIAQAGDPRAFNYTPQWNTGDPIQISFSESKRAPSVENQSYQVAVTFTKGGASETYTYTETVPFSQALRDAAEVANAKQLIAQAGDPRAFNYTPQWNTGDPIQINFSESKRAPSVENQSYQVAVTFTKGGASETYTYTETVPFSQALRDAAEVANAKQLIAQAGDPRAFNYTPQWNTGDPIQISFSESKRAPSVENQSYQVAVTFTKGGASETYTYTETVPFSQALRDAAEVANAKQLIAQAGDPRAFNYTPQWNTGDPIQISFSEPMRTPIGVDQNYEVTVTLGKGNSTEIYSFMEFVPSNNIKVDLPDGSIALLNENFDNPYRITNGGIFENEHNRSKFAGAAFALDASTLQNVESAQDLLTYLIDQSTFKSDFTGVSLRVGKDGSLVARYEIQNYNDNLYQLLQAMLSGINYEILDPIDFSQYSDVANVYVDFYIEYSTALNSYVIVAITDKTLNDDTEINNIVNKDSVVTANETLATETESFTYMNKSPLGDFIFVVDDSGSMSEEQEAAIDAIQQTFQASVHKYGIDWKATVIGTEEGRDYSASVSDFAENNLTKLVQQLDSLGTNGADEVGLKRVYEHLINGSIVTRENATLDIVYVSDEECHSQLNEIGLNDGNLDNSYFVQEGIRLNAVIPEDHSYEEGDLRSDDLAYRMAIATQGEIANLRNYETGYNRIMDAAIRHAAAATSDIQLQYPAIASSITVYVNDLLAEHWEYDPNENSIVFLSGFEPQNGETVKVVYNHIDYQSLVDVVKGEFDALPNDQKRNYGYAGIEIVFDPTDPLPPLQNADQTYEVNVSFNAYGYEAHSSYMETIPALSFSIATIDDWNQTAPLVFESLNHGNSTSSELVLHMDSPATVDYSVSSESNYDYLEIFSNGTSIGQFSGSQNGSINIQTGDEIKFVYSKDGSASNGDDKAIIAIH